MLKRDYICIGLHWLIKLEWNTKHKIPYPRKIWKDFKPYGLYLQQLLRLCNAVFNNKIFIPNDCIPYSNGLDWFISIANESVNSLYKYLDDLIEQTNQIHDKYDRKRALLNIHYENIRNLKDDESPFVNENGFSINKPYTLLIESAIAIKNHRHNNKFSTDYYKPYLQAYKDWVDNYKASQWQRLYYEDGSLRLQLSSKKHGGRGSIAIPTVKNSVSRSLAV